MYSVQIMPDATFVASYPSIATPKPVVGVWFSISQHTLREDAQRQQSMFQDAYPGYRFQIVQG